MAQAPLNKLCLATLCSASQKAGHFPCGKSLVLPRAPADISAQRKFVIWLANNVRETNLFSSFGYGENLHLWVSSDAKYRFVSVQFDLFIKKMGYRGVQTSANSHNIQCEHHLVAVLFVCKKSLLERF